MDELVIGDQRYISSKRAADITGYAKDYIGQLCREGRVEARLVGRSWYVREAAIKDHRFGAENDSTARVEEKRQDTPELDRYVSEVPKLEATEMTRQDEIEVDDTPSRMQEAWQSWFSQKRGEEPEEQVSIERIVPNEVVPVAIHRVGPQDGEDDIGADETKAMSAPGQVPLESPMDVADEVIGQAELNIVEYQERDEPHRVRAPRARSILSKFVSIFMICLALLSIAIAILGTGLTDSLNVHTASAITRYISGAEIIR